MAPVAAEARSRATALAAAEARPMVPEPARGPAGSAAEGKLEAVMELASARLA